MNSKTNIIIIQPEHNLLRRYTFPNPPNVILIKEDGSICSTCFHLRPGELGISVDIEHLTTYEISIKDRSKYRLLSLNAGDVQNLNLTTIHDPLPDNDSHALILGKLDKKIPKKLADISKIVPFPN